MQRLSGSRDFDSYEIEEPSDEERAQSSSEDELEVLLNGTPQQKQKLIREYLTGESESSSADEFEKEMEAELSSTMKNMEGAWNPGTNAQGQAGTSGGGGGEGGEPQMYDKVYFDSDSDEEDTPSSSTGRRRRQRTVLTNDELLYDPDEDERDQAWVDNKRRQYQRRRRAPGGGAVGPLRSQGLCSSDAVLNCPACMTTLCLDCQRHEKYRTQYRAMFVMNCTVRRDEVLRYRTLPDPRKSRKRRKRKAPDTRTAPGPDQDQDRAPDNKTRPGLDRDRAPETKTRPGLDQDQEGAHRATETGPGLNQDQRPKGLDSEEVYHPVQCSECSTEVAVFDKDEVYHFFNILASHC